MNTEYHNIIIIGYGKAAKKILEYVKDRQNNYGYQMEFIEYESDPFCIIKKVCTQRDISFIRLGEKKLLKEYLESLHEKTLIISVGNNYIFPGTVIEKENITIINFHNALLPDYPGRNAPSWAIYMNEKKTGITWHYVSKDIDRGNIIVQKSFDIGEDTRAYELAGNLMELAYEGFIEIFDNVLNKRYGSGIKQSIKKDSKMYFSNEIPSNGIFDLTDTPQDIYRLLRSVDYGNSNIFPKPRTYYQGEEVEITRFRKISRDMIRLKDSMLYLPLGTSNVLSMKYKKLDTERMLINGRENI